MVEFWDYGFHLISELEVCSVLKEPEWYSNLRPQGETVTIVILFIPDSFIGLN